MFWRLIGCGGKDKDGEDEERADESVEAGEEEVADGEIGVGVRPKEENDEDRGSEDLSCYKPTIPLFGR